MGKLDESWNVEPYEIVLIKKDLWIKIDDDHMERVPNNSITKWLINQGILK